MPTYQVPLEAQPEFDDLGPLSFSERMLMGVIKPLVALTGLVTIPRQMYRTFRAQRGYRLEPATEQQWLALPALACAYFDETTRTLSALGFGAPRREVATTASAAAAYT